MKAIDKTVYDTLKILRFDGGEPQRISEDYHGVILYESQGFSYRVTLDALAMVQ